MHLSLLSPPFAIAVVSIKKWMEREREKVNRAEEARTDRGKVVWWLWQRSGPERWVLI
jgi:hypothetical protein